MAGEGGGWRGQRSVTMCPSVRERGGPGGGGKRGWQQGFGRRGMVQGTEILHHLSQCKGKGREGKGGKEETAWTATTAPARFVWSYAKLQPIVLKEEFKQTT